MTQDPVAARPKTATGVGVLAIGIALMAVILCWLPFFGVWVFPLAGIALVIGIVGFVIARSRQLPRIELPIIGALLAGLAIIIAVFVQAGSLAGLKERMHRANGIQTESPNSTSAPPSTVEGHR